AAHYTGLVREADSAETSLETINWTRRLVRESDNFRAVFDRLEIHDPELILATAGKLMILGVNGFWRGFWTFSPPQARRWLERAIEIGRTIEVPDHARREHQFNLGVALSAMSMVGYAMGRHEEGATAGAEAIYILRPYGETWDLAYALGSYAFNLNFLGRADEAIEAGREAREIARLQGDGGRVALSFAVGALGMASMMKGDLEQAQMYLDEGKAAVEESGTSKGGPQMLVLEGHLVAAKGDLERAEAIFREAQERFEELGEAIQTIITRSELAHVLRAQGKWEQALPLYRETILFFQDMGHEPAVANQLECFAYIAIAQEEPEKAARLLGASEDIRERTHNPIQLPWEKAEYGQAMTQLEAMLGREGREAGVVEGRSMSLDEAVAYARAGTSAGNQG
ncbi:MAG: tetratricopeptide repeat protein, partial [Anaerolineales bacterium]|nr:tetratricopeptide repeat protein [Anaerolineales bacterium]